MGIVYLTLSMSLDGFIAGPNDDVSRLHAWVSGDDSAGGSSLSEPSRAVLEEAIDEAGASVVGRRTYDLSNAWGGRPPFPIPFFVVSHDIPPDMQGDDAPFTFVTEGVEAAILAAKDAAGDKNVSVAGAEVCQQALRAGLLDEIQIHLVPVLLGDGVRLFERLGGERRELERIRVVDAPEGVTHLRFRVRR